MLDSRLEFVPLPLGHSLSGEKNTLAMDIMDYCHVIGKLIFLIHSCPNISYAVGVVSQFMSKPE